MIRPIETYYRGHRFRSRLEARWAIFLNRLKITYHYEFEGFHLPSGDYLPDFYCPNIVSALGAFIEIKPLPCPYKPRRSTSRGGLNKNLLLLPLPHRAKFSSDAKCRIAAAIYLPSPMAIPLMCLRGRGQPSASVRAASGSTMVRSNA